MIQLRYYMLLLLLVGYMSKLYAQIDHVYHDDQFMVSRVYAGLSSTTGFPIDSVASYATADFRAGAMSAFMLSKQLKVKFWGVVHIEKNEVAKAFNSFALQITPNDRLNIQAGLVATPTTILRPNPTTWQSQVETNTQQTIIPGRPGGKIGYQLTPDLNLTYGLFNHDDYWFHHGSLKFRNWQLAGYGSDQGLDFLAIKYGGNKLETMATYVLKESVNALLIIKPGEKWSLLADAVYDLEGHSSGLRQLAVRRHFRAPALHLQSFLALTYDWDARAILGQVFLYLN